MFTAVQRVLGLPPGDLTEEMIDAAMHAQVAETDDLDFKSKFVPLFVERRARQELSTLG